MTVCQNNKINKQYKTLYLLLHTNAKKVQSILENTYFLEIYSDLYQNKHKEKQKRKETNTALYHVKIFFSIRSHSQFMPIIHWVLTILILNFEIFDFL